MLFFLLSDHILCIVKKIVFEILTYFYVLRSPEFIYAIFTVTSVCTSEHDAFDWVCILQVIVWRTQLILVNIGWIVFFTGKWKRILIHYGIWIQILKVFLNPNGAFDWAQIWYAHYSIQSYILCRFLMNLGLIMFLQEYKNEFLYITAYGVKL